MPVYTSQTQSILRRCYLDAAAAVTSTLSTHFDPGLGPDLRPKWCLLQRFLQEHGEVQLSALGIAISSMVTVAEILKNKQLAEESRITTSLEWLSAESR